MPAASITVAWAVTAALTAGAALSVWFAVRGARRHRATYVALGLLGAAASVGTWLSLGAPQHIPYRDGTVSCIVEPLFGYLVDGMDPDACVAKNRMALGVAALVALGVIALFTSLLVITRQRRDRA